METVNDPANECVCQPNDADCMFCLDLKNCKMRKDALSLSGARVLKHVYPPD